MCSAHLDITLNTPLRLIAVARANFASGAALPSLPSTLKPFGTAAPLMHTWMAPNLPITALTAFCTEVSSLTSVCTNMARSAPISATACSPASMFRSKIATRAAFSPAK
ncbi:hypothetical protein D3C84_1036050 [compost metagenome]